MKLLVLVLTLTLIGCGPVQVKPPISTGADEITPMEEIKLDIMPVPDKPKARTIEDENGTKFAAFDSSGIDQLSKIVVVAKTNTEALTKVSKATNAIIQERNAVASLVQVEEKRANVLAEQWAATENQRRHEEQQHFRRQTVYEFVIVILVVVLAL